MSFLKSVVRPFDSRPIIPKSKFHTLNLIFCLLTSVLCFLCSPYAADAGTAAITVGWDPTDTPGAGYEFCYGSSSSNYDYVVDVGKNTSCTISGLKEGTRYYFAVKAYNSEGLKSPLSEELAYTVPVSQSNNSGADIVEEVRVRKDADDAEEDSTGYMFFDSSDLEFINDIPYRYDQTVGLRFVDLDIPQGATIVNAYVQFKVDETGSGSTFLTIKAQDSDDAQPFTSAKKNISNRTPTAAAVSWNPAPWRKIGEAGADQRTPDLSSIIQEVVNRPGWSGGNSLVLMITGTGTRTAESYKGDASGAPLLHVVYSEKNDPNDNQKPQPVDTDGDGISDDDEINIFGTDPNRKDTDNDGINDGEEQQYWGNKWSLDFDGDGASNLTDADSDGDGLSDGVEVSDGKDPADATDGEENEENHGPDIITEVRVRSVLDNAEEFPSGGMYFDSTDLELVDDAPHNVDQTVGLRFVGLDIPQGATIVNAYVQFKADEKGSGNTDLTIEAQDSDNAQPFTSSKWNISNRAPTAAAVTWDPAPWTKIGEAGAAQRTPDLSSIIQEVVNRPGWSSGNSMALIITGSGKRTAESYRGDPNGAPLLHVEYSDGEEAKSGNDQSNTGSEMSISDLKPEDYKTITLNTGDIYYIDRKYKITELPSELEGLSAIQTANDDKNNDQKNFLSFYVNQDVTLYVAYDSRATRYPDWLNSYTNTGLKIRTTDASSLSVWKKELAAGVITLPGNYYGNPTGIKSNYFVLIGPSANTP